MLVDIKELESLPRNYFVDYVLSDHVGDKVELCWWILKNLNAYQEMTLLT